LQEKPLILITSNVEKRAIQFKVTNPLVRGSGVLSEEITVEGDGKICVHARIFNEIITSIQYSDSSIVEIGVDNYGTLEIKSGDYKYVIGTLNPIIFPYIDDKKPNNVVTIKCEDFRKMIRSTAHASNRSYPHMQLSFGNNLIRSIATDTTQLPVYGIEISSDIQDKIIVSAEAMTILRRLANGSIMKLAWSSEEIACKFDSYIFRTRAFNAPFPLWEELVSMTDANPRVANLDATTFRHIMSSAVNFGHRIELVFVNGKLSLSSQSDDMGRGNWDIKCDYKGEKALLTLSSRALNEYVKLIKGGELKIKFSTPTKPVLITWSLNDNYKYIIMPIEVIK
jgi:DNA polymerase III sliding clamp (beta) subunit (PCNA family)